MCQQCLHMRYDNVIGIIWLLYIYIHINIIGFSSFLCVYDNTLLLCKQGACRFRWTPGSFPGSCFPCFSTFFFCRITDAWSFSLVRFLLLHKDHLEPQHVWSSYTWRQNVAATGAPWLHHAMLINFALLKGMDDSDHIATIPIIPEKKIQLHRCCSGPRWGWRAGIPFQTCFIFSFHESHPQHNGGPKGKEPRAAIVDGVQGKSGFIGNMVISVSHMGQLSDVPTVGNFLGGLHTST